MRDSRIFYVPSQILVLYRNIVWMSRKLCAPPKKNVRASQINDLVPNKFSASPIELWVRQKNWARDHKILCTSQQMRVTYILHQQKKLRLTKQILRMSRNFYEPPKNCSNFQTILCLSQEIERVTRKLTATTKKKRVWAEKNILQFRKFCVPPIKSFFCTKKFLASQKLCCCPNKWCTYPEYILHLPKHCVPYRKIVRVHNIVCVQKTLCPSQKNVRASQINERVFSKLSDSPEELCACPKNCARDEKILGTSPEIMCETNNILHHPKQLRLTKQILRMSRNFYATPRNCANFQTMWWFPKKLCA
jgi:hypothetical protein